MSDYNPVHIRNNPATALPSWKRDAIGWQREAARLHRAAVDSRDNGNPAGAREFQRAGKRAARFARGFTGVSGR